MYQFNKRVKRIFDSISSKMKIVLENVWFKRVATLFLILFAVNYLFTQYENLNLSLRSLSIDYTLLAFSSIIIAATLISSVFVWKKILISLGSSYPWIEIAKTQMLSSIGKYVPGHIWNYSSKIYLTHKLGFPIKFSGLAVIIEIAMTYMLALCLFLLFMPGTIIVKTDGPVIILMRIFGAMILLGALTAPYFLKYFYTRKNIVKNPHQLFLAILIRTGIWVFSSYAFSILVESFGFGQIGLPTAVAVITSSFFIGFLAIFTPDGLIVREAIIIYLLRNFLSKPDATILSLIFRFQLIVIEFIVILVVIIIWNFWKNRSNEKSKTIKHNKT